MKLDSVYWKILQLLQQNSRRPLKDIAHEVGLSSPAVADRIQKLEDTGVISRHTSELDMDKLGYSLGLYISIKLRFGHVERFEKYIQTVPEICECHKLTGTDCMLMKGFVTDPKHLDDLNRRLAVYGELTTSLILNSIIRHRVYHESFGPD